MVSPDLFSTAALPVPTWMVDTRSDRKDALFPAMMAPWNTLLRMTGAANRTSISSDPSNRTGSLIKGLPVVFACWKASRPDMFSLVSRLMPLASVMMIRSKPLLSLRLWSWSILLSRSMSPHNTELYANSFTRFICAFISAETWLAAITTASCSVCCSVLTVLW